MNFLFVHQNFPGQFRHVAAALAGMPGHRVVAIGESANLKNRPTLHPAITVVGYQPKQGGSPGTHHYLREYEGAVRRGQEVARTAIGLKEKGFLPDVVVSHPAWGESMFLRDVFPKARHVTYFEYFYQATGGDVGFDPEYPSTFDDRCRVRVKNTTQLLALESADDGISPTTWQKRRYPEEFRRKIRVIHEGIDTSIVCPDSSATLEIEGLRLKKEDRIITYVGRNLEPYRGFHVLMRTLPLIQERCPGSRIVIVGGDDVSYGKKPPAGKTYRSIYTEELHSQVDWSRVHFTGRLPYSHYLNVLRVSSAHVYLTYPFVLSWSMLEAMAAGCLVVGSSTAPVQEVVRHGENGLLVDFFDKEQLSRAVGEAVNNPARFEEIRRNARKTAVERYDLKTRCLPEMLRFLTA
ncbi:MAG: glycosyltransferase [Chlorobiaceae bacterium]|nr:glycosyltransferase [Chlorobiaceae bacterium]